MLKEPKVECIIMACFGPDALDPNMPDPPSHANQIWAGFAQHDLGLPWKNETELDHVGNHIWHDSGCMLAIMAISKMLPNQIPHVYWECGIQNTAKLLLSLPNRNVCVLRL